MKTKDELNTLKAEVETLNRKLQELTEEELEQVTGGSVNLALKFASIRCDDDAVRKGLKSASSKFEDLSD